MSLWTYCFSYVIIWFNPVVQKYVFELQLEQLTRAKYFKSPKTCQQCWQTSVLNLTGQPFKMIRGEFSTTSFLTVSCFKWWFPRHVISITISSRRLSRAMQQPSEFLFQGVTAVVYWSSHFMHWDAVLVKSANTMTSQAGAVSKRKYTRILPEHFIARIWMFIHIPSPQGCVGPEAMTITVWNKWEVPCMGVEWIVCCPACLSLGSCGWHQLVWGIFAPEYSLTMKK